MISSRRISKFHNQLALLRFNDNYLRRYLTNNVVKHIEQTIDLTETCRFKLFEPISPSRYFSTSPYSPTRTKAMQGEGDRALNLDYQDILNAQKDETVLIVDVREDDEIKETGKLPGSIHIPMGEVKDVLQNLSEQTFVDKFQKPKPSKDTKIIFSCRSGKRSAMVQGEMLKLGYEKSYNYTGGWLDWESKQKSTA